QPLIKPIPVPQFAARDDTAQVGAISHPAGAASNSISTTAIPPGGVTLTPNSINTMPNVQAVSYPPRPVNSGQPLPVQQPQQGTPQLPPARQHLASIRQLTPRPLPSAIVPPNYLLPFISEERVNPAQNATSSAQISRNPAQPWTR